MDEAAIRKALDGCLLKSKEEFGAFEQAWTSALAPKEPPKPKGWWQR